MVQILSNFLLCIKKFYFNLTLVELGLNDVGLTKPNTIGKNTKIFRFDEL